MFRKMDVRRELAIAWCLATAIACVQALGGAALLVAQWPAVVANMPGVPAAAARFWLGAVFASPLGLLVGLAWQRWSGASTPRTVALFCTVACIALPLVGIGLLLF